MKKIRAFLTWLVADKRRLVVAVIILATIIFGVIKLTGSKATSAQYQTAQVTKGAIISTVSASGQILNANVINIGTDASGVVAKVLVKDGQKVTVGQTVATLNLDTDGAQKSSQALASYLSAKNSLANAQTQLYSLQNAEFVANQKFINDAVARGLATDDPTYIEENALWLASEANYKNQANAITQSQVSLSNAWQAYQATGPTITAPMNGIIDNITITPGMVLTSSGSSSSNSVTSQRVAVIRSTGNPLGTYNVSEIDVTKIIPGQKATITLDSIADKTFTGKVQTIDRIGTVSSNVTNYAINILFDTGSDQILPNMSSTANIIIATKDNVLMVPTTAIQTANGQSTVRVLNGSQVNTIDVVTGLSSDTDTEIISGLTEGQTIITGNVFSSSTTSNQTSIFSSLGRGGASGARVNVGR